MMRSNSCPKCQGSMTEGFVLEHTPHGSNGVSQWVEGAPEKSIWSGVKTKGKTQHPIQAWRCGRCGFLEHYAK